MRVHRGQDQLHEPAAIHTGAAEGVLPTQPGAPQQPLGEPSTTQVSSPVNERHHPLLKALEQGDLHTASRLLLLVYEKMRKLAAQRMAEEQLGRTLRPTALVHEVYIRLVGDNPEGASKNDFQHTSYKGGILDRTDPECNVIEVQSWLSAGGL
jgi:hypothetical protein